jgi:hypothetical protein
MANQFTETTHTGIGSHLGSSIKGVFTGLILILVGIILLWKNEGRAVKTAQALEEGSENVISIKADKVDQANNKKLVHVSGLATTTDTVFDKEFNIKANALKIIRTVEHYQWKESSIPEKWDGKAAERIVSTLIEIQSIETPKNTNSL